MGVGTVWSLANKLDVTTILTIDRLFDRANVCQ